MWLITWEYFIVLLAVKLWILQNFSLPLWILISIIASSTGFEAEYSGKRETTPRKQFIPKITVTIQNLINVYISVQRWVESWYQQFGQAGWLCGLSVGLKPIGCCDCRFEPFLGVVGGGAVSKLCNEHVTHSEDSYCVCVCLIMCDLETSTRNPMPSLGCGATEK